MHLVFGAIQEHILKDAPRTSGSQDYTDKEQHDLKACQRGYGRSCIINDWCEPDRANVNTAAEFHITSQFSMYQGASDNWSDVKHSRQDGLDGPYVPEASFARVN